MRRWLGGLAAAAVLAAPSVQAAPERRAELRITGAGGQQVELTVGRGELTLQYPVFDHPRLPGPDGTVGGFAVQRASDGELAGGMLLQNVPGFERALPMTLAEHDRTTLPAGRYRITLLGTARQTVQVGLPGAKASRRLSATGPARPVTRSLVGTAELMQRWSKRLGRIGPEDQVVVGAGSGGDFQQAEQAQLCLRPGDAEGGLCLGGSGGGFSAIGSSHSAGWSSSLYGQGSLAPGPYVFDGVVVGAGPASRTMHLAVVISLRR